MGTQLTVPEAEYPHPVIRQSVVCDSMQLISSNGTDLPTLGVKEFIPLFLVGEKGAIVDFIKFRYEAAPQDLGDAFTIRYTPSGTAMTHDGTAISNTASLGVGTETDWTALTINTATNTIPAYGLVYADINNAESALAPPGVQGLVFDIGWRVLTN